MTRAARSAVAVLRDWPDAAWVTESELGEHLLAQDAEHVEFTGEEFAVGGIPLRSVLNAGRREGLVIRDRRQDPPAWRVTPTGRKAAVEAAATP